VGIGIVVLLFTVYNHFLLDNSIERIRLALAEFSQANSLFETENPSFLLQDLLVTEIGKQDVNLERLVASESFTNIMNASNNADRKQDAEFLLQNLLSSYEKSRSPVLRLFDQVNRWVIECFYAIKQFWNYLFSHAGARGNVLRISEENQAKILRRAREYELNWQFDKAAQAYELFLKRFPEYSKANLVRLYLVSVYLRSNQYGLAQQLLSHMNLTIAFPSEVSLAATLRRKLAEMKQLTKRRAELGREINKIKMRGVSEPAKPPAVNSSAGVLGRLKLQDVRDYDVDLIGMLFEYGLFSLYLFDLKTTRETFQELLSMKIPEEVGKHAKWLQGWVYLLENNYEESRRLMRELLVRYPQDRFGEMSQFVLASIAEQSGEFEQAAKQFENLASNVDSKEVSFLLNYRAGGVYLYNLNNVTKAQNSFVDAKQSLSSSFLVSSFEKDVLPALQTNMRNAAFQRFFQGDILNARKFFEDVLQFDQDDAWANCGYGLVLYMSGEKSKGLDYVQRCRSLKKDEYTNSVYAFVLEKEGRLDEAAVLYQEAINGRGNYVVALYNLARLEIQLGELEEALMHLKDAKKEAGRLSNYASLISNNLGIVYWRIGDITLAENEFLSAVEVDENFPDAHFNLAQLYERGGNPLLSKKHLKLAGGFGRQPVDSIDRIAFPMAEAIR